MSDTGFRALDFGPAEPWVRPAWCRWDECRGCESGRAFFAQDDAIRWLKTMAADAGMAQQIRRTLAACGDALPVWRADDQGAIDQLAALLVTGRVRVCGDKAEATVPQAAVQTPAPASAPSTSSAVPIGVAVPRQSRSSPPPPPVEEQPVVELDVAAMVATMRAAARDGVPFCEECARKQREAA